MEAALQLAEEAFAAGEVPVGAVVVKDGQIIGRGRNRREAEQNVLGHAEIEAMTDAARTLGTWRLENCTLYVTLEPCPMCAGTAVNAHMARIVYGAEDDVMGACGTAVSVIDLPRAFKPELYRGLLAEECAALLRKFFEQRRK
ncbi:MAG: nucleoside deaminase [Clostridia bacterium]|nr:nucleoside deaminase [Clostridia bacterium]